MKKLYLASIICISVVFVACASAPKYPAGMETWYVTAEGSDRNNGFTEETAFRSLFKALVAASNSPIKTITVLGTLDVKSEQSTNTERVFLIHGRGKDEVLIRGAGTEPAVLSAAESGRRVTLIRGSVPIRLENIEISGGTSSGEGAGIGISPGATLILGPGCVIRNNTSQNMGGGVIVAPGASLIIDGGKVLDNHAATIGGGIVLLGLSANNAGTLVIRKGEVSNNQAQGGGGIAVHQGAKFTLYDGTIHNNTADYIGGGVLVSLGSLFTMDGGVIQNNHSLGMGGGLAFIEQSAFIFVKGEITRNQADENGGGIVADAASSINMEGGFVSVNEAASQGGGIFTGGPFVKTGGKIYGSDMPGDAANKAKTGAAVYFLGPGNAQKIKEKSAGETMTLDASANEGWDIVREE
jgi:hypothetical protein